MKPMDLNKFNVNKLRTELWTARLLAEQRCLGKACEWIDDVIFALPQEGEEKLLAKLEKDLAEELYQTSFDAKYELAKNCFIKHEYARAAHILRDYGTKDRSRFLHYFAKYKNAEKRRIYLMGEVTTLIPKKALLDFYELRDSLERSMGGKDADGWLLYVYALVMHKFRLYKRAVNTLEQAISLAPQNWSAWFMLSNLIESKDQLNHLDLPNHLFKVFFYYLIQLALDIPPTEHYAAMSVKEIKSFLHKQFRASLFVKTLNARALIQVDQYSEALEYFRQIRAEDPFRIDGLDVYSNALYMRQQRKELAKLAYEVEKISPHTCEANICIANSYSIRDQHAKAIVYLNRSLKIDPDHTNSWTLIGHEYLDIKCIEKALKAYRNAISLNRRDCRAWIGLGNIYDAIMSSPNLTNPDYEPCLYYYSQVLRYRPKDANAYASIGNTYQKMGNMEVADACFRKAGIDPNTSF